MRMHWKLKSLAFSTLEHLPEEILYFAQRRISRRSRLDLDEIVDVWRVHDRNINGAANLIEFGAGKSLAQNLYFSRRNIQQTVVDLYPMLDFCLVNEAIEGLVKLGVDIESKPIGSAEDLEDYHRIQYVAPCDMRSTEFNDNCFDACVCTSTMEHIPPEDLKLILIELKRILKPGGIVSAHIDYSDHYGHTDHSISRLNFLRFDEKTWSRYNHDHHYQNRLRHGHFLQLFSEAGFHIKKAEAIDPPQMVPHDIRPELMCNDGNDLYLHGRFLLEA